MKKIYQIPEINIVALNSADMITLSYSEDKAERVNAINVSEMEDWLG